MARRYEAITLNGKYFTLDTKETVLTSKSISRRTVDDCYSRPSSTKQQIFDSWFNWFIENGGYCGVASYNCNFFTIEGYVFDSETNEEYFCYITHANHKCWRVEG